MFIVQLVTVSFPYTHKGAQWYSHENTFVVVCITFIILSMVSGLSHFLRNVRLILICYYSSEMIIRVSECGSETQFQYIE